MKKVVILLITLGRLAYAAGFGVAPPMVWVELEPGTTYTGTLRVLAGEPSRIHVQVKDWRIDFDGRAEVSPPGTESYSLTPFLDLRTDPFEVRGRYELRYRIALPSHARGCYSSALLLYAQSEGEESPGLRLEPRLTLLVPFFVQIKDRAQASLVLSDAHVVKDVFTGTLRNEGDGCLHMHGTMHYIDEKGEPLKSTKIFQDFMLPGSLRRIAVPLQWPEASMALRMVFEGEGTEPLVWEVAR